MARPVIKHRKARAEEDGEGYVKPTHKGQHGIKFHEGGEHESLGIPKGHKIPASKHAAARAGKYGVKAERQELFRENVLKGRK